MSLLNASSPSPAQPLAPSRPTSTGPSRGLRALQPGAQSRRRPTALYALTAVVTVFAIVGLQLVLSVAIAQGAFQAERLESEAGQLDRSLQVAEGQLQRDAAPQNLSAKAAAMGMVSDSVPAYLRLSDGSIVGAPQGADASPERNLVANALLAPESVGDDATATSAAAQAAADKADDAAPERNIGLHSKDAAAAASGSADAGRSAATSADNSSNSGVSEASGSSGLTPFKGTLPAPSTH